MSRSRSSRFGVVTDVGNVRDHNEDAWLAISRVGLFVVADGMGGHQSGEVASQMSVESLRHHFEDGPPVAHREAEEAVRRQTGAGLLADAVKLANTEILAAARVHAEYQGMGTTLVALWVDGAVIHTAHVGDSRLYRLRGGALTQLTKDHSLVNEYLRLGVLKPSEVEHFPYKNVIVRALGLSPRVEVETSTVEVAFGDRFLLCSDGLSDLVKDEGITERLVSCRRPNVAARALTEDALAAGGYDNITALVVDVVDPDAEVDP